MKPGFDPADIYPTLARKPDAAQAAFEAEVEAAYQRHAVLREQLAELRAEPKRARELEEKYSPSQPRVPSGNPRGGQWTDRGGGQGTVAGPSSDTGQSQDADLTQPMGNVDIGDVSESSELGDLFQIKPDGPRTDAANLSDSIVKVAASDDPRFYTPDLAQEDNLFGGHALRRHNERSESSLIDWLNAKYQRTQTGNLEITQYDVAEGTFRSREEANDLVNQVLKRNTDEVDQVAAGKIEEAILQHRFGFVTGKEAYRPNGDSDPYIRPTYSVRVVIRHDTRSWRGYRVHTAFPVND
ncbi:RNase A-like domain-containing protein [Bradyrhizobium sp.]|uniref:RNase A-like domain-containing protein n=1 Tax=Bradyrhizobium sp. TaxID=376 RepID=UPI002E0B09F9|nr:RNase A-like domain-containing protein [Bradyrhizobium sp.]